MLGSYTNGKIMVSACLDHTQIGKLMVSAHLDRTPITKSHAQISNLWYLHSWIVDKIIKPMGKCMPGP